LQESTGKFLRLFKNYASVYDISAFLHDSFLKKVLTRILLNRINAAKKDIVFGCNSQYFYDLLPGVDRDVFAIDLLHGFSKPDTGSEDFSLPYIEFLDKRVVINNRTKSDLREQYLKNNIPLNFMDNILVIPNQVRIPGQFHTRSAASPLKVIYAGRASKEKRVHLLGKIAAKCTMEGVNAEFVLIGDGIKGMIDEADRGFCTFLDAMADDRDLYEIYAQSHILLIVSSREGFPMVVMEAMANGVLPVCTDVGGIREHIQDSVNGFLVTSVDEQGIVGQTAGIISHLSTNREKLNTLACNAYFYAREHFAYEPFYSSYRNLLLNCKKNVNSNLVDGK
jgi:L-malate glycosyltransferase